MNDKEIRIYAMHDEGNKFIGQIKFDGFRKTNQWTALNKEGERIRDVETQEDAEILVWKNR